MTPGRKPSVQGLPACTGPCPEPSKGGEKISEEGKDRGQTTKLTLVLETIRLIADLLLAAFL